jgi:hypothetical protein
LGVNGGKAALDADGNADTNDTAEFGVTLDGGADGRVTFDELFANGFDLTTLLSPTFTAGIGAVLPLEFNGTPIGPIRITIANLVDFFEGEIGSVTMTVPDFESFFLNAGILSILRNPTILADGADYVLTQLQAGLTSVIETINLPVVSEPMLDSTNFINDKIRDYLIHAIRDTCSGVGGHRDRFPGAHRIRSCLCDHCRHRMADPRWRSYAHDDKKWPERVDYFHERPAVGRRRRNDSDH